ncbi:MAG: hypothetical protein H7246_14115 [Phycisphaerae bacterium]|nr:hypothetical protein [Saprospiraceae bacterium]
MRPLPHDPTQLSPSESLPLKKSPKVSENASGRHSLLHSLLEKLMGLVAIFLFVCLLNNGYAYQKRDRLLMQIKSLPHGFSHNPDQMGQDVLRSSREEFIALRDLNNRRLATVGVDDFGPVSKIQYLGLPITTLIQHLSWIPINTAYWEVWQEDSVFVAQCTYQIQGEINYDSLYCKTEKALVSAMAQSMLKKRLPISAVQLEIVAGNNEYAGFKADSLMHVRGKGLKNQEETLYQLSLLRTKAYWNVLDQKPKSSWKQEYERRLDMSIIETRALAQGYPERECQFALLLSEIQWKGTDPEAAYNTLIDARPRLYKIQDLSLRLAYTLRLFNNLYSYDYRLHPKKEVYENGIACINQLLDKLSNMRPTNMDDACRAAIKQARGLLYSTRAEIQAKLDPNQKDKIISDIHWARVHDKTFHFNHTLDEYDAYQIILPILARNAEFCAELSQRPEELRFVLDSLQDVAPSETLSTDALALVKGSETPSGENTEDSFQDINQEVPNAPKKGNGEESKTREGVKE